MRSIFELANRILSAAILLTAFSLVIYVLRRNSRSQVGRAFCILLSFTMVVYLGDVAILAALSHEQALIWLKFQWFGIAFIPAAYLHFSDALLNTTSSVSKVRRLAVRLAYLIGGTTILMVMLTPWIVRNGIYSPTTPRLQSGPLFLFFAAYFFAIVLRGAININHARKRCLTATSRRRMGYLTIAFAAPALGVFPYMLLTTLPAQLPESLLLSILLIGNLAVAVMIVVMAYTVTYFGAFTPDRMIKYELIDYLLRGPLLASLVVVALLTIPKIEVILGLPSDLFTLFTVVLLIVLAPQAINLSRPFLNRLVYRKDVNEVAWIQELDTRLLMPSDLEQFLENTLSAIAERLRVHNAFVLTPLGDQIHIEAACGDTNRARALLGKHDLRPLLRAKPKDDESTTTFTQVNGFTLGPLWTQNRDAVLGILVLESVPPDTLLESEITELVEQAEVALEDRALQQGVFVALQQIMPDIERIQKRQGLLRYMTSLPMPVEENPVDNPSFTRWVKDALTHYWGGPKLTHSPLLKMNAVTAASQSYNNDQVQALRHLLQEAIDALRPEGTRVMTAPEWTIYNILDLKFREGHRMNDIAHRLAVSESDLYRKQKTAIAEVSRMLERIERQSMSI